MKKGIQTLMVKGFNRGLPLDFQGGMVGLL